MEKELEQISTVPGVGGSFLCDNRGDGTIIDGTAEMVSANGDKVFLDEMEGYWWFTGPSSVEFNAGGIIAGGTGRFINASGTWNGSGEQVFYMDNRPQETVFTWDGSITY